MRAAADRHAAMGYPVRILARGEAAALEPDLLLPADEDAAFAWYPEEGWLEAAPLVARLLGGLRARGGRLRTGVAATAIEAGGDGSARRVRLADGSTVEGDVVVLAAGTGSEALARAAGVELAMAPSPGLLVVTSPEAAGPRRVVHSGALTLRPDGGGRVMLASRAIDGALPPDLATIAPDAPEPRRLLESAAAVYPALAAARVEAARVGRRSVATDGLPVAGVAPGVPGLYLLVSHSGATLAAILGRLVAGEVLGTPAPELEPYRMTEARAAAAASAAPARGAAGT